MVKREALRRRKSPYIFTIARCVAERRQRHVARLGLVDLTADEVVAFLDHIEKERHGSIATRNCRLAGPS